ncbi:MAG TPA: GNAT family N-acetyltransferase [Fibrobacteria bacterium]|nr:GNAT family N-acetyltransferase [Fibrobacteria bacterium]
MDIRIADLSQPQDATDLVALLDTYARDSMGGGRALEPDVKGRLARDLSGLAHCLVLLARVDGDAAGVAVCFEGYSTFAGAPLLNLHDFAVAPGHRGRGVARALMERLFAEARARGCCKVTLEVLSGNHRALSVYRSAGFAGYELDPATGHALFLQKKL